MYQERARNEAILVPGLEKPREVIGLGAEVARRGRTRYIGSQDRWEISTVIGVYGGNLYKVRYEGVGLGDHKDLESLELTGADIALTIRDMKLSIGPTEAYVSYYLGGKNVLDLLSGLDPIPFGESNQSSSPQPDEEEEQPYKGKLIPLAEGFHTTVKGQFAVVAKSREAARSVYSKLFEQDHRFEAMRHLFSDPDRIPFMTPEQYENIQTPEQIQELTRKMIEEIVDALFPEDEEEQEED